MNSDQPSPNNAISFDTTENSELTAEFPSSNQSSKYLPTVAIFVPSLSSESSIDVHNKQDNQVLMPIDQCVLVKDTSNNCYFLPKKYAQPQYLDEKFIDELISRHLENVFIDKILEDVFSNPEKLSKSFHRENHSAERSVDDLTNTQVDFQSLRSSMKKLFDIQDAFYAITIFKAIVKLSKSIAFSLQNESEKETESFMHCFVICFDMIMVFDDSLYYGLAKLSQAVKYLSVSHHARLTRIWAIHNKDHLSQFVKCCQETITCTTKYCTTTVHENHVITAVTKILEIAFYANILAGDVELSKSSSRNHKDGLETELGVSVIDSRKPLIPFEDFHNHDLSEVLEENETMAHDYLNYSCQLMTPGCDETIYFSFLKYPFILSPTTKAMALDLIAERKMSSSFYFKLEVRRHQIITDTFDELEDIVFENHKILYDKLFVKFVNEEAYDESGVSREFFQEITKNLFHPYFELFIEQEDTSTVWFNPNCQIDMTEFLFTGIVIGLAVYNRVPLNLPFPMVVFRKLLDRKGSFHDLADWNPTMHQSLKSLLEYKGDDMEDVFMQTFRIGCAGKLHDLKPNGDNIIVDQHNKQEFVDLFSDYLLNQSVNKQFRYFKRGFEMVTEQLPLKQLIQSAEELELLICGSKVYDFEELKKATDYKDGYTENSRIIKDFWTIVDNFSNEMMKTLLEFVTGSNCVPVGGLKRLKLVITRHGPDSDLLPSSSTCFKILFLPEYSSREKLEERLLKSLKFSNGFGLV